MCGLRRVIIAARHFIAKLEGEAELRDEQQHEEGRDGEVRAQRDTRLFGGSGSGRGGMGKMLSWIVGT